MAIQDSGKAVQILTDWCAKHQNLKNNEHNIRLLSSWIKANHGVAGELILTTASLDMAFLALSSQLEFYPSAEDQQKIEQANQQAVEAQQQLADELAEKNRKAEILRRELERDARQAAQGPGRKSAYDIDPQDTAREQRDAQDEAKKIQRAQLHAAFLAELRDANNHLETMSDGSGRAQWGKTNDARTRMKENLKRKFPAFAEDVK